MPQLQTKNPPTLTGPVVGTNLGRKFFDWGIMLLFLVLHPFNFVWMLVGIRSCRDLAGCHLMRFLLAPIVIFCCHNGISVISRADFDGVGEANCFGIKKYRIRPLQKSPPWFILIYTYELLKRER